MSFSWRKKVIISPSAKKLLSSKEPVIFAHWHGDELTLISQIKRFKIATMTSKSKDGELINSVLIKFGAHTSRGSSSRGAISGLKGLVRLCRQGHPVSFAVDGPRGPIYKTKPGVFELSKISQAQVIPVAADSNHKFTFQKSWNKTFIPLPFSKVVILYGEPIPCLNKTQDPRDPLILNTLDAALVSLKKQALDLAKNIEPSDTQPSSTDHNTDLSRT